MLKLILWTELLALAACGTENYEVRILKSSLSSDSAAKSEESNPSPKPSIGETYPSFNLGQEPAVSKSRRYKVYASHLAG